MLIHQLLILLMKIKNKYNYVTIENLFNIMADFRMVKEAWEVENIVKAIDITKDGIYNMMRNSRAGMMEYQIESYFDFALKQHGVKDFAFKTIAASGKNATVCIIQIIIQKQKMET